MAAPKWVYVAFLIVASIGLISANRVLHEKKYGIGLDGAGSRPSGTCNCDGRFGSGTANGGWTPGFGIPRFAVGSGNGDIKGQPGVGIGGNGVGGDGGFGSSTIQPSADNWPGGGNDGSVTCNCDGGFGSGPVEGGRISGFRVGEGKGNGDISTQPGLGIGGNGDARDKTGGGGTNQPGFGNWPGEWHGNNWVTGGATGAGLGHDDGDNINISGTGGGGSIHFPGLYIEGGGSIEGPGFGGGGEIRGPGLSFGGGGVGIGIPNQPRIFCWRNPNPGSGVVVPVWGLVPGSPLYCTLTGIPNGGPNFYTPWPTKVGNDDHHQEGNLP